MTKEGEMFYNNQLKSKNDVTLPLLQVLSSFFYGLILEGAVNERVYERV